MIAAEECAPAEYDILRVHPILGLTFSVILEDVCQTEVSSVWPQGLWRDGSGVCEEIIAPLCPQRPSESHEGHLDWSWAGSENFIASTPRVPIQVDKNVNTVPDDLFDKFVRRPSAYIPEDRRLALDLLAMLRAIAGGRCVAERFRSCLIMEAKDRLHEVSKGVVVKV